MLSTKVYDRRLQELKERTRFIKAHKIGMHAELEVLELEAQLESLESYAWVLGLVPIHSTLTGWHFVHARPSFRQVFTFIETVVHPSYNERSLSIGRLARLKYKHLTRTLKEINMTQIETTRNGDTIIKPKFHVGDTVQDARDGEHLGKVREIVVSYLTDAYPQRGMAFREENLAPFVELTQEQAWDEVYAIMLRVAKHAMQFSLFDVVSAAQYTSARAEAYRTLGTAHIKIEQPVKDRVRDIAEHRIGDALGVNFVYESKSRNGTATSKYTC